MNTRTRVAAVLGVVAVVAAVVGLTTDTYYEYARALTFLALPAANGFPLVYGLLQPWWRNNVGRALVTKATCLAVLLDLYAAAYLLGDYTGRDAVRAAAFTGVVAGIWYQFLVFAPTIWRGHRQRALDRLAGRAVRVERATERRRVKGLR